MCLEINYVKHIRASSSDNSELSIFRLSFLVEPTRQFGDNFLFIYVWSETFRELSRQVALVGQISGRGETDFSTVLNFYNYSCETKGLDIFGRLGLGERLEFQILFNRYMVVSNCGSTFHFLYDWWYWPVLWLGIQTPSFLKYLLNFLPLNEIADHFITQL